MFEVKRMWRPSGDHVGDSFRAFDSVNLEIC